MPMYLAWKTHGKLPYLSRFELFPLFVVSLAELIAIPADYFRAAIQANANRPMLHKARRLLPCCDALHLFKVGAKLEGIHAYSEIICSPSRAIASNGFCSETSSAAKSPPIVLASTAWPASLAS